MAISNPTIIPMPWASQGQTIDIPQAKPEMGRASWEQGFPPETAIPESAGGIPPHRLDMQGVLTSLSEHAFFVQSGSIYTWNAALDYNEGATILGSNGVKYIAVAESGPSSAAGARNPVNDALFSYWKPQSRFLLDFVYPVGTIYMSANNMSPALIWGGSWKALDQGRVLIGASGLYPAGSTGGSNEIRLTTAQLPAHSHSGSTSSAGVHSHTGTTSTTGSHTHTRGTMNITGSFEADDLTNDTSTPTTSGAFSTHKTNRRDAQNGHSGGWGIDFNASRSWTGQTSAAGSHNHTVTTETAGAHTHTVTVGNTGQGQNINIMQAYLAVYMWQRIA